MRPNPKRETKIQNILMQLAKYGEGSYDAYLDVSEDLDEIDAISAGLNLLGDKLKEREKLNFKETRTDYSLLTANPQSFFSDLGIDSRIAEITSLLESMRSRHIDQIDAAKIMEVKHSLVEIREILDRHLSINENGRGD